MVAPSIMARGQTRRCQQCCGDSAMMPRQDGKESLCPPDALRSSCFGGVIIKSVGAPGKYHVLQHLKFSILLRICLRLRYLGVLNSLAGGVFVGVGFGCDVYASMAFCRISSVQNGAGYGPGSRPAGAVLHNCILVLKELSEEGFLMPGWVEFRMVVLCNAKTSCHK